MPIYQDIPQRDYEEALRSLGRLFDEQRLEDLLLVERESGFLVTGLRRAESRVPGAAPQLRYEYAESTYPDSEIGEASVRGMERRGSGDEADRNEQALRLIGRHANETGGSRLVVIDQGGDFMLRMLMKADSDMPHRFATITVDQLELMAEEARAARRERETVAKPH